MEGLRNGAHHAVRRKGSDRFRRPRTARRVADRAGDRLPRAVRHDGRVGHHVGRRAKSRHGVRRQDGQGTDSDSRGRRRQPHRQGRFLDPRRREGRRRRDPLGHAHVQQAEPRGAPAPLLGDCRCDAAADHRLQRPDADGLGRRRRHTAPPGGPAARGGIERGIAQLRQDRAAHDGPAGGLRRALRGRRHGARPACPRRQGLDLGRFERDPQGDDGPRAGRPGGRWRNGARAPEEVAPAHGHELLGVEPRPGQVRAWPS